MVKLSLKNKLIFFIFLLLLIILSIYSYALIDPNLTLVNHPLWAFFRDNMVYLGYHQRIISWYVYLAVILGLFLLNYHFVRNFKNYNPITIGLLTGSILLLAYPFLSHDFFNYMFDAKILTFYHQSPYVKMALDFPGDAWIRFMHWTNRTYPYGPVFFVITLVPSFLSFGKFVLAFIFFKFTFIVFYLLGICFLQKKDTKWAINFATHPLIIIEGLVSSHNDLIGLSLALIGIYFLFKNKKILSILFLLFSGGIKYLTLPLMALSKKIKFINIGLFVIIFFGILYTAFKLEIQPWYFLSFFCFLPIFPEVIEKMNIFFLGLLLSYYPYIRLDNGWGDSGNILIKHRVIYLFAGVNLLYLILKTAKNKFLSK